MEKAKVDSEFGPTLYMYWIPTLILYFRWSILEKEPSSTSPNINDWIPSNDPGEKKLNFTDVVAKLHHDIQSDGFFTWIVAEDDHNSSQHVIQMDQVSKCAMYDFHDCTDTLKFWTEKLAINKTSFVFHLILMKLGEVLVTHVYYNFPKFH